MPAFVAYLLEAALSLGVKALSVWYDRKQDAAKDQSIADAPVTRPELEKDLQDGKL